MAYRIEKLLGVGGMGQVYRAWDDVLERPVALKYLRGGTDRQVQRFVEEARRQARVRHENVCEVYEAGEHAGRPFIAMRYVDGERLDAAASEMSLEERLQVLVAVAEGVQAAHRKGLVHRDLKPGNVMVERTPEGSWHPYVVDFGLAVVEEDTVTASESLHGTPAYMAPEQAFGGEASRQRAVDVWALGAILYQLIGGRPAYETTSAMSTLLEVIRRDPVPLRRIAPQVDRDLETIVETAMARDPQRRYESARLFAEDLERILRGEPILARRASWTYRASKWVRRNRLLSAVAAGALLLVALTALFSVQQASRTREQGRIAQQLVQQAEEIVGELRLVYLAPLHDIRAERSALESRLEEILAEADRLGEVARGPAALAVGRAALGFARPEEARRHLEAAWRDGYRDPRVARYLASALGELYRSKLGATSRLQVDSLRQRELQRLDREFRRPALQYFERASGLASDPDPMMHAEIAFLRGDYSQARRFAAEAGELQTWRYDASVFGGDVAMAEYAQSLGASADEQEQLLQLAIDSYRHATEVGSSDPDTYLRLCTAAGRALDLAYFTSGVNHEEAFSQARNACRDAGRADPGDAEPDTVLAAATLLWARHRNGAGDDALPILDEVARLAQRAIELDPTSAAAHRRLGEAWVFRGEFERDREQDSSASLEKAADALAESLRLDADDPMTWNALGLVHWERMFAIDAEGGDNGEAYRGAAEAFRRAVSIAPEYAKAHSNLGAVASLRGETLADRGEDPGEEFDLALAAFEQAIAADPEYAYAYNNLGNVYRRRADYRQRQGEDPREDLARSLELFDAAASRLPDWPFPHFNAGLAQAAWADWQALVGAPFQEHSRRAVEAFERGIRQHPQPRAYLAQAQAQLAAARHALEYEDDASTWLRGARRAIDASTAEDSIEAAELAFLEAQQALQEGRSGNLSVAEEAIRRVIERAGGDGEGHWLLARVLLERARREPRANRQLIEQAEQAIEESLAINPDWPAALWTSAQIEILRRRIEGGDVAAPVPALARLATTAPAWQDRIRRRLPPMLWPPDMGVESDGLDEPRTSSRVRVLPGPRSRAGAA